MQHVSNKFDFPLAFLWKHTMIISTDFEAFLLIHSLFAGISAVNTVELQAKWSHSIKNISISIKKWKCPRIAIKKGPAAQIKCSEWWPLHVSSERTLRKACCVLNNHTDKIPLTGCSAKVSPQSSFMGNPGNVYLKCFTELVEKSVSVKSKVRGRSSFSFDSTGGHNNVSSLVNTLKEYTWSSLR